MAYIIYSNDGSILTTLSDGEVDTVSTSLTLIGKNVDNYGQYINNNFVKLLSSSASSSAPLSAQKGQLWFDTTNKKLKFFDGLTFQPTSGALVNGTVPISTSTGEFWFDTINNQLKVWNGNTFKLVGPSVSSTLGKFGVEPPHSTFTDILGAPRQVGVIYCFGDSVAVISTETFETSVVSGQAFLDTYAQTTLQQGLNVNYNIEVKGKYFLNGVEQIPSYLTLSTYYDLSFFGDHTTSTTQILNDSNNFLRFEVLPKVFSTATTAYETGYPLGSIAKVVTVSSTSTTTAVRVFRLEALLGRYAWEPYNVFPHPYNTSTITNIIIR